MSGGIFISYRRDDSAGYAGRIYDRLTSKLEREKIFIDVDNIPLGSDFVKVLSDRVGDCDALIAIIGRNWTSAADQHGGKRLDDPNDFVRIEIEAALAREIPVIPVYVGGAIPLRSEQLPEGLKALARRQGLQISHERFDSDSERLTKALGFVENEWTTGEAEKVEPRVLAVEERAETKKQPKLADSHATACNLEESRQNETNRTLHEIADGNRNGDDESSRRTEFTTPAISDGSDTDNDCNHYNANLAERRSAYLENKTNEPPSLAKVVSISIIALILLFIAVFLSVGNSTR